MQRDEILQLQRSLKKYLDYESVLRISTETGVPLAPPITASIAVTSRCNSNCMYCSFRSGLSKNKIDVELNTIKRIINELAEVGVKVLTFTGGEPLLRKDLSDACRFAREKGMTIHITTNGLLLTREIASRLNDCGVSNLIMSLDSLDDSVYSIHRGVSNNRVLESLEVLDYFSRLQEENFCAVTFVVSRKNYKELPQFVRTINAKGKKILVNVQPYHKPPAIDFIPQKTIENATKAEHEIYASLLAAEKKLLPKESDRESLTAVMEELIAMKKNHYPINNSDYYLRSIPGFMIDNKLPEGICAAGFSGIYVQENLNMLPCWRLPEVGNLANESAVDLWFSDKYAKTRQSMLKRDCCKCMFLCHNEPGWYGWYNRFFQEKAEDGKTKNYT